MTDPTAHVPRIGFRGRALTYVGLVWLLVGANVVRDPSDVPILGEILPTWIRVALWAVAGVIAVLTAWWPPGADRWGFMALTVPATIRAIAYAWSTFLGVIPFGGRVGDRGDWVGALGWVVIVGFVLLLAKWPEPVHRTPAHRGPAS